VYFKTRIAYGSM